MKKVFYLFVIGMLSIGCSEEGSSGSGPENTAPPSNLRFQAVSPTSISLIWDYETGNEDGFEISQKINDGEYNIVMFSDPNTNNALVENLGVYSELTSEYYFKVRAQLSSTSYSDYSNECHLTLTNPLIGTWVLTAVKEVENGITRNLTPQQAGTAITYTFNSDFSMRAVGVDPTHSWDEQGEWEIVTTGIYAGNLSFELQNGYWTTFEETEVDGDLLYLKFTQLNTATTWKFSRD